MSTSSSPSYKAGHSIWKTRLSSIDEEPVTNSHLHIYDVSTSSWMKYPEDPPFRISGGATVWHLDKLYLIGGYTIEYDCELKCFYQSPVSNVWIFDPSLGTWCMGPPLPKEGISDVLDNLIFLFLQESFVAKNKTIKFRGYCLGQSIPSLYWSMLTLVSPREQPPVTRGTYTTVGEPPWPSTTPSRAPNAPSTDPK